ncbi:MAG: DUF5686 family protein [Bacteroidetes bacterium]|nr:DUF5686 family protein [Bacteroidota bacterium]
MKKTLVCFILLVSCLESMAQVTTRIRGSVIDIETNEPLPFVNISFVGTTIGTTTDIEGNFTLETDRATVELMASFVGYNDAVEPVNIGKTQRINFQLTVSRIELDAVTIEASRLRYTNKDNPAVEIIRKVIDNKSKNRKEGLDFYEFGKYEKIELDLNNLSEKFVRKNQKKYPAIVNYLDTLPLTGKAFIPLYLREISSKVYYQRNPQKEKEYRNGIQMVGFDQYIDDQGLSALIDKMFQSIDIYDNNIDVLTQKFVSPISSLATSTYKYYITDTLDLDGSKVIKLAFLPRNPTSLAFDGELYVVADSSYAIKKVRLQITKSTNINFVDGLEIEQEFDYYDDAAWMLAVDKITIDFKFKLFGTNDSNGLYGKRTVSYEDFIFGQEQDAKIFRGVDDVIEDKEAREKSEEFWAEARHMELTASEAGIYQMVEEVKDLPTFKKFMNIANLVLFGYRKIGPIDLGPVSTFYSFSEIEGLRTRLGFKTNDDFSRKVQFETYGAYGFKDEKWKYAFIGTYFFSKSPRHGIELTRQVEIANPGERVDFVMEDNVFLSFKRSVNDKKIYHNKWWAVYFREFNGFSFKSGFFKNEQTPAGILSFRPLGLASDTPFDEAINTTEIYLEARIAPNEQYYQGKQFRIPIINKSPIFKIRYTKGLKDVLGSDYSYDKLDFEFFKRTYMAPFGFGDLEVRGVKLWGQVPYPLLNMPRANQTFFYQPYSFNQMNFLEFVGDETLEFGYNHHFNGYLFGKIPFLKKAKLRATVGFKGLIGRLTDKNNPTSYPDILPGLPVNVSGSPATFALNGDPYFEINFGVENIFKVLRLEIVKRLTQLDNPNAPNYPQIMPRIKIKF